MTPKEKAEELADKMLVWNDDSFNGINKAKQCALIAVEEILETKGYIDMSEDDKLYLEDIDLINYNYWQEVKTEIQKL